MSKERKGMDIEATMEWANSGKGEPVIASRRTQERHDSEWQNIKVIHKDDKEGLRKALEESKAFRAKYGIK